MQISKLLKRISKILFVIFLFVNLIFFGFQMWRSGLSKNFNTAKAENNNNHFADLRLATLPYQKLGLTGKKIVLRLVKIDCQECQDSILNNTVKLSKAFGKESVVVLMNGDYGIDQYLAVKRLYQYSFVVYQVSDIITSYDHKRSSYYFQFEEKKPDKALKVYELFEKNDAGHTPLYRQWLAQIR